MVAVELFKKGPRTVLAESGVWGTLGGMALLVAPAVVLGRFVPSVLGVVDLSDAPFTYTMSGWEPLVLAKTIGPLTIAILALGWVPALFGSRLRPIQQLDEPIRDLTTAVEPLADDQALFVEFGHKLTH